MRSLKHANQKGFSAVEGLIFVLVLVVIAGAGYMVLKRQSTNKTSDNGTTAQTITGTRTTVDTTKVGTTEGIDQLTTLETQDENSIDTKYEATEKTDSTSTNKSVKDIGGAYDEATF